MFSVAQKSEANLWMFKVFWFCFVPLTSQFSVSSNTSNLMFSQEIPSIRNTEAKSFRVKIEIPFLSHFHLAHNRI